MRRLIDTRVAIALITGLGVACGVVLVSFGILILVEMSTAGETPSSLLPPTDRHIVVGVVVFALIVGALVAGRCFVRRWPDRNPWATVAIAALAALALGLFVGDKVSEHKYLSAASSLFPSASKATLKDDGHQACGWLRGRHWGAPPDIPSNAPYSQDVSMIAAAGRPSSNVIKSTRRLFVFYSRYLDRHQPGPFTADEQLQREVTFLAWYKLCPLQQWVHRPLHNGDD